MVVFDSVKWMKSWDYVRRKFAFRWADRHRKSDELKCHLYPLGFQRGKVFVIVIVILVPSVFQAAYRIYVEINYTRFEADWPIQRAACPGGEAYKSGAACPGGEAWPGRAACRIIILQSASSCLSTRAVGTWMRWKPRRARLGWRRGTSTCWWASWRSLMTTVSSGQGVWSAFESMCFSVNKSIIFWWDHLFFHGQYLEISAWVLISSRKDFSLGRCFYIWVFISSHCWKKNLNIIIYH